MANFVFTNSSSGFSQRPKSKVVSSSFSSKCKFKVSLQFFIIPMKIIFSLKFLFLSRVQVMLSLGRRYTQSTLSCAFREIIYNSKKEQGTRNKLYYFLKINRETRNKTAKKKFTAHTQSENNNKKNQVLYYSVIKHEQLLMT